MAITLFKTEIDITIRKFTEKNGSHIGRASSTGMQEVEIESLESHTHAKLTVKSAIKLLVDMLIDY